MKRVSILLGVLLVVVFVGTWSVEAARGPEKVSTVYLDEMDVSLSSCGWQQTVKNRAVGGAKMKIAGVAYKRGIGTHSYGVFRINLFGAARRLTAMVGLDDEVGAKGLVEFQVVGDKKMLWKSGEMRGGQAAKAVDVNLTGVKQLDLIVTLGSDDNYGHDHSNWCDAKIEYVANKKPRTVKAPGSRGQSTNRGTRRFPDEQALHPAALSQDTDRDECDAVLRRTGVLAEHIARMDGAPDMKALQAELAKLQGESAKSEAGEEVRDVLLAKANRLRRKVVFANPLLNFDKIVFIKRHFNPNSEKTGNHMCDQYFGFNAIKGGGLFVLSNPFSDNPTVRNVLENSVCTNGRFKGKKLDAEGGFLSPELSYDGKKILFAFTEIADEEKDRLRYREWTMHNTWKIFEVNVDGTGLHQLTDGTTNDFDPCYLPSGRIAFISERRGGYGRCHGRPVPSFTLHSMNPDGSDIVALSPHETNEWQPSVDHHGMIIYTRWDYVDRGFNQAHHPWITTPDGRDPRVIHGNYASSPSHRPHFEITIRAVPNSHKYSATAACHHGQAYGSLVLIDPKIPDDNKMGPVKRITPDQLFPESECRTHGGPADYASAWPLSEMFYLAVYCPNSNSAAGTKNNYGIHVVDAFGNKELVYRDENISCLDPMPLRPRAVPRIVPHATALGRPLMAGEKYTPVDPATLPKTGIVGLVNVNDSTLPMPAEKITHLRVIQLLPKTTPYADNPRIGYGAQKGARAILGSVPVEADGSVYFNLPVDTPVYFQAIDENGMAVQSMRSATYVHPGEKLICQGCHDNRSQAPITAKQFPTAMSRQPSDIVPELDGTNPFSFARLVQPVLDSSCVACHTENLDKEAPDLRRGMTAKNKNHWHQSYLNLRDYSFFFDDAVFTTPRTIPGKFGARASKLYKMLKEGHYEVDLTPEQMHRITLWLDSNSDFFGSYENLTAQANGEIVLPSLR